MAKIVELGKKGLSVFDRLDKQHKIYAGLGAVGCVVSLILFLKFNSVLMAFLVGMSDKYRKLRFGKLIMFMMLFAVSFPPMIGYTAMCVFTGMAYGFPNGWPLLALGTTIGSSASFVVFRTLLKSKAEQMAANNKHFSRLTKVLERDSFFILWLIRLYPLPYSLSNGAMSAVGTIHLKEFTLATALSTFKLFLPLFMGSRIVAVENGNGTKLANILSMSVAAIAGVGASYLVYKRMQREEELEREQALTENTATDEFEV